MAISKPTTAPAFQFYPKDWLTSQKVRRMSLAERGAYITLLAVCWLDGSLPNDPPTLAREIGVSRSHFDRMWSRELGRCFTERGGRLYNARLDEERRKQAEFRKKQAENGRRGGRPKKGLGSSGFNLANPNETQRLTQTEAKKSSSSSSPISNLQVQTASRSVAPRAQTLVQRRRMDAAFEGPRVYVPIRTHTDFVALLNRPDAQRILEEWYEEVSTEWATGARRNEQTGADMIRFWKARFDEKWPPAVATGTDERKLPAWARKVAQS